MPKAKYEGIYHSLKKRIEAQDYPYQSLLPSENTLIEKYACSRNTVRRALAELVADGYVQTMQGRGVRVIYQPVGKTTFTIGGIETFQETARRNRLRAVTKVTKFETVIADECFAAKSGFSVGDELWSIERVRYLNGKALILDVNYFLKDIVPGDKVFSYLEGALNASQEIRKVPEIYLLALSKFYAGLPSLDPDQQALCRRIMEILTGNGMLFAYFKKLSKYAELSGDVLDKEIIEYHGSQDVRPVLKIRILPDEEEFHEEEMRMVYKGIYIRQKVLFEGEIMEYEIYEEENGALVKKAGGEIDCKEVPAGDRGNRFSCLNSMSLFLSTKEDAKLKEAMTKYVTDNMTVEELFPLK